MKTLLYFILSHIMVKLSHSYFKNNSMIFDLESTSSADLLTEAQPWVISACSSCNRTWTIPPNTCNIPQETVFAGPNTLRPNATGSSYKLYLYKSYSISSQKSSLAIEFDLWTFHNAVENDPSNFNFSGIVTGDLKPALQMSKTLENSCTMDFSGYQGKLIKSFYKFHVRALIDYKGGSTIIDWLSRSTLPSTLTSFGLKNIKLYWWNSSIAMNSSWIISEANFPCQVGEFWNGSTCGSCPANCEVCSGNQCSACKAGYYKDQNGGCLEVCQSPRKITEDSLCVNPCSSDEYFYQADQLCKPTCLFPYKPQIIDKIKICYLSGDLTIAEVQAAQSLVTSQAAQAQATGTAMKATSAFSSSNPSLALLAGQASMLFYIRYIDVKYPAKLSLMLMLQDASPFSFSFGIPMPRVLDRELEKRSLPEIFERYELHSNFLWNYWDTLSSLVFALFLVLVVSVLKAGMRKCWIFETILSVLKWNIPLMVICASFGEIFFYGSLQIHASFYGSAWEILSFLLAIIMVVIGITIVVMIANIVKQILEDQNRENAEKKWKDFGLLFESYKRTSLFTFGYMGVFMIESIMFNLIITNLYSYPLAEILLITVFSFVMFFYLVIKTPFKERLELVQLLWNKILLIIVNVCVSILAIMDELKITGYDDLRNSLGETIVMIFTIFSISSLAFMALGLVLGAFFLYKFLKRLKSQDESLTLGSILKTLIKKESGSQAINEKASEISISITTPNPLRKRRIQRSDRHHKGHIELAVKPIPGCLDTSFQGLNVSAQQDFDLSFDSINPSGANSRHAGVRVPNLIRKFDKKGIDFKRNNQLNFEKNHHIALNVNNLNSGLSRPQEMRKKDLSGGLKPNLIRAFDKKDIDLARNNNQLEFEGNPNRVVSVNNLNSGLSRLQERRKKSLKVSKK